MVQARLKVYGPPPAGIDGQIEWFRDALRDSVKFAARTNVPHLMHETPVVPSNFQMTPGSHHFDDIGNTISPGPFSLLNCMGANGIPNTIPSTNYDNAAQLPQGNQLTRLTDSTNFDSQGSSMNFGDWPLGSHGMPFIDVGTEGIDFEQGNYVVTDPELCGTDLVKDWNGQHGST